LSFDSCLSHVAELVLFNDELSQEISQEIDSCLQHVAKLLLSKLTKLESESLLCDMYEALNNFRIMSRASYKDTDKQRVNQINENSKLKSEIYQDAKTICTEEREALNSIKSKLASRTCVSVED